MQQSTTITRTELVNTVREIYGLDHKNVFHFKKSEMMEMTKYITGETCEWTSSQSYFYDYLESYGYTNQVTVDTHPTFKNLLWLVRIANEIQEIDDQVNGVTLGSVEDTSSWLDLLKQTLKISYVKQVTFKNKTLTVEFE